MSLLPVIVWFRSDLRLADNPALTAACGTGAPIIPVYILDDKNAGAWQRGAASKWWLHHSLSRLADSLKAAGFNDLVLYEGPADQIIPDLVNKTGATAVFWNRCYEPWVIARDKKIKQGLSEQNIEAHSFKAYLLFEPWEIKNKTGGPYKVFTPYSKACLDYGVQRPPLPVPKAPPTEKKEFVTGIGIGDLRLIPDIKWYLGMEAIWTPGEQGAHDRLDEVLDHIIDDYKNQRDFPAVDGVSRLSPYLHFGEISPSQIWMAATEKCKSPAPFLRQLIWREFSYHLLYHFPDFPDESWNPRFKKFKWQKDQETLTLWQKGQTGYPIIDAGMRQLWQTGWMHNRVRMIVGSFLVKNLLIDWREGEKWFWDTLVDADLGNNAAGWQWIAGSGADAAPYFRIFNPVLQGQKFDPDGEYIRTFVPELAKLPNKYIYTPWEAPPLLLHEAGVILGKNYPEPVVNLTSSRDRALEAYADTK